jgi:hypothetical protein
VPDAIYDFERSWNCHRTSPTSPPRPSPASLSGRVFGLLRLVRSFEGQYLALELGVNVPTPDQIMFTGMGLHREREILTAFHENHKAMMIERHERIDSVGYEHCVLWGAGAKGLAFLNAVDKHRRIAAVADLNPGKHGHFLPTGHRISRPDELRGRDIRAVIITNPAYRPEIEQP